MSWTGLAAAAAIMIPTITSLPEGVGVPAPHLSSHLTDTALSAEISVLTYNVKGLPWPIAQGRAAALREIGRELARLRRDGRQPDVVLIQEGFLGAMDDLVKASGYRYWAKGPGRSRSGSGADEEAGAEDGWRAVRYPLRGEGWGKFTGSGLYVLSDLPVAQVETAAYRHCAGVDCLANKGVMLVRLALPGGREVDVVNTHFNTKRKAGVPRARTLQAYNRQTDEFLRFLAERHRASRPLLVGGDFNVRNAPERYDYRAAARPYKVVAEFCSAAEAGCEGQASPARDRPWLQSQDLQAFHSHKSAEVRPVRVETLFQAADGKALSDHPGYLVRYRISWPVAAAGTTHAATDDAPGPFAAQDAPVQRLRLSAPIASNMELVAVGSSEKRPKTSPARREAGPAGRASTARGARVGLLVRW